jgi:hypothetical protein
MGIKTTNSKHNFSSPKQRNENTKCLGVAEFLFIILSTAVNKERQSAKSILKKWLLETSIA